MNRYVKYYAGLVALYIVVAKSTDLGSKISATAQGFDTATKSLQGRS